MAKKEFEKNVVVAVFDVESEGYEALTKLRQAAGGETYLVSAAALIKKQGDICYYLDGFDTGVHTANDAMAGGLIGMLVGILGGPLGVLLGGSFGALVGTAVDAGDAAYGASMLDQMAGKLDDGMVAIIALAGEESDDELDKLFKPYKAVVARFDAEAVADEVDKAYETQCEMARQAKERMYQEWSDQTRAEIKDSIEKGKAQFKDDLAFTIASIKEANAEYEAEQKAKREQAEKEFEENSEILRHGFSK